MRFIAIFVLLLATYPVWSEPFSQREDVQAFIHELVTEYGLNKAQVTEWMDQVQYQQSIVDAFNRPAEKTKTYQSYKPMFVSDETIRRGLIFRNENRVAFERAEKVFGVPSEIILSIIAVESRFGGNKGSYRVMDALSTIGFYIPRRSSYFQKELREFIQFAVNEEIDPFSVNGSYAGAMGFPQFMPSSIRGYAVDFDFDGHIDIWDNPVDAIGSVGNYLRKHRWQMNRPITLPATVSGDQYEKLISTRLSMDLTYESTQEFGWFSPDLEPEQRVLPFKIETETGFEYWFGLRNFYAITRYNHSLLYAMTVNQLSEHFVEEFESDDAGQ